MNPLVSSRLRLLAVLFLVALPASAFSQSSYDPLTMDPATVDAEHPASVELLKIESGGAAFNARLYRAAGAGPHPTVVYLHGFPGIGAPALAPVLQRAGYHVLFPHYRGTWGSGGTFSTQNAREDVRAALAFLRSEDARVRYGVDPKRLLLVGHSFGGWLALHAAAEDPGVACVAALAPANLGRFGAQAQADERVRAMLTQAFGVAVDPDSGPIRAESMEALVADMVEHRQAYDLDGIAPALRGRHLLIVAAARDQVTPPALHQEPLVRALRDVAPEHLEPVVLDTDHDFSNVPFALGRTLLEWLPTKCIQAAPGT